MSRLMCDLIHGGMGTSCARSKNIFGRPSSGRLSLKKGGGGVIVSVREIRMLLVLSSPYKVCRVPIKEVGNLWHCGSKGNLAIWQSDSDCQWLRLPQWYINYLIDFPFTLPGQQKRPVVTRALFFTTRVFYFISLVCTRKTYGRISRALPEEKICLVPVMEDVWQLRKPRDLSEHGELGKKHYMERPQQASALRTMCISGLYGKYTQAQTFHRNATCLMSRIWPTSWRIRLTLIRLSLACSIQQMAWCVLPVDA